MNLSNIDIALIVAYLVGVVAAGIWFSKRASRNIESYFLGGKTLPWYVLSISNASGMFDIAGTMWMVSLLFMCGVKSAFIPWLWPTFNQIVLMVFLAAWLRRSNVLTGAEWIRTRFGNGPGATLSHISVVVFALISVVGFLCYAFQAMGKFAQVFLPWDWPPAVYGTVIFTITTFYVILGGMYSVVLTDIIQFIVLTIVSVFVAVIAFNRCAPYDLAEYVPAGWGSLSFGWRSLNIDWTGMLDAINGKIGSEDYSLFGLFLMMCLFKGVLASLAGPAPNYDMQRVLATKSPKEASLMSGFVTVVLFLPRYLLIAGITLLALIFFRTQIQEMGADMDFERILPLVMNNFIPTGLLGIMMAGLLAAFMSTFDSTVNAGAAYLVNDIYKKYIAPDKPARTYVYLSYAASLLVVVVGVLFGFKADSVSSVLNWIVAGLYGGYVVPNVLKWYWWRFNGYGYFSGMTVGVVMALVFPKLYPNASVLMNFPYLLGATAIVSIIVTLITPPQDRESLKAFYKQVRPWGFWGPIRRDVMAEDAAFQPNRAFARDMANVVVGIIWQMCFVLIPIYLMIRNYAMMGAFIVLLVITSLVLKFNWYDKLEEN